MRILRRASEDYMGGKRRCVRVKKKRVGMGGRVHEPYLSLTYSFCSKVFKLISEVEAHKSEGKEQEESTLLVLLALFFAFSETFQP